MGQLERPPQENRTANRYRNSQKSLSKIERPFPSKEPSRPTVNPTANGPHLIRSQFLQHLKACLTPTRDDTKEVNPEPQTLFEAPNCENTL